MEISNQNLPPFHLIKNITLGPDFIQFFSPSVLLLGPRVAASAVATSGASPDKAWLILAWVSTVAGNLTLVGSAANIIVCEKARSEPKISYNLTFWGHLKYGFFSTLVIIIVGLPWIGLL
jgi:Na+/H+ antiporter NhaD/arsenite permease-like protein